MTTCALSFRELLDYTRVESERWHRWLAAQPSGVLDLPVGVGRTATARGLIHHIILVERRYTDRLRGEPITTYESVPADSLDTLFGVFDDTRTRLEEWLATATDADLARRLEFQTLSAGTLTASAHKIVVLHKGHVVETGTHDALLAGSGLYRRLVARQAGAALAARG